MTLLMKSPLTGPNTPWHNSDSVSHWNELCAKPIELNLNPSHSVVWVLSRALPRGSEVFLFST